MSMLVLACITPLAYVAVFGAIAFVEERSLERERLEEVAAEHNKRASDEVPAFAGTTAQPTPSAFHSRSA